MLGSGSVSVVDDSSSLWPSFFFYSSLFCLIFICVWCTYRAVHEDFTFTVCCCLMAGTLCTFAYTFMMFIAFIVASGGRLAPPPSPPLLLLHRRRASFSNRRICLQIFVASHECRYITICAVRVPTISNAGARCSVLSSLFPNGILCDKCRNDSVRFIIFFLFFLADAMRSI